MEGNRRLRTEVGTRDSGLTRTRDHLRLHILPLAFANVHGASLPFIRFQKIRIEISVAVKALPRIQRVVAGADAAQTEPSRLITDGLAVTIGVTSQTRLGH